jgi:hypothetical protein
VGFHDVQYDKDKMPSTNAPLSVPTLLDNDGTAPLSIWFEPSCQNAEKLLLCSTFLFTMSSATLQEIRSDQKKLLLLIDSFFLQGYSRRNNNGD